MKRKVKKKYHNKFGTCTVCSLVGVDLHHIKTQKSGGSDENHNLIPLCRKHHVECHAAGMLQFSKQNEAITNWLTEKGWSVDEFLGKWVNPSEFVMGLE